MQTPNRKTEFLFLKDLFKKENNFEKKRNSPDSLDTPILKAISIGINAPNPHNIQSWKFKITGDFSMFLYINENILLPETDPTRRQIHMGAGCFIETLVIGATSLGYSSSVTYFPEGYVCSEDFGVKPVAEIILKQDDSKQSELASSINLRQTNRKAYHGSMITDQEFENIRKTYRESHSKIVFINSDLSGYQQLLKNAFETETRLARTHEETRIFFRFSENERKEKRDGLSIPQMGYRGVSKFFAEKSLQQGNAEIWHSEKTIRALLKNVFKGIESSKGLVFWITESNTFEDWVKAGRDFAKFSLALTKLGFYAHPYTQITQEYEEMKNLQHTVNSLLRVGENQKVQMIVRIGRSSPSYFSYRKEIKQFI